MNKQICSVCSKSFSSKKKTHICLSCKQKQKKQMRAGMSQWEWELKKVLEELIPFDYIDNGFYSWMKSPKGSPLQLDRYYPSLEVAFEFNGEQHYTYNSFFHKNKETFEYYKLCDKIKEQKCQEKGIVLLNIRQDKYPNASVFRDFILKMLKKKGR
ncbi:MAG: hypothetical protein N2043_01960 [Ignavibacterium sp.]|nr:hypothetical protein [Ignavibacterium sp.]